MSDQCQHLPILARGDILNIYTLNKKKQDTKLLAITSPTDVNPIFKIFSLADSVVNLQQTYV